jgi:Zn-finger nucleic acid-binding protein
VTTCPVCRTGLAVFELEGVEIDHCVRCRGTWLDAGELEVLAALAGGDAVALGQKLAAAPDAGRSVRPCPRCRRRMRRATVSAVEVDRCSRGHGLWLDAEETGTLIRGGDPPAVAGFLRELYRHELDQGGGTR